MKKRGKVIYVSHEAYRGLETLGNRYISKKFLDGKRISYNKSIKFLLELVKIAEKIKLPRRLDDDDKTKEI
jgi:hypothetical protein